MAVRETETLIDEAAAWFTRLQGSLVSARDRQAFEAWVEADPARAVAYARVEATWERTERLTADGRIGEAGRPVPRQPLITRRIAAAGIATVGLGVGVLAWRHGRSYSTEVGQRRTVVLADGSRVTLNTASRLAVAYEADRRGLRLLAGEALFEVVKDPGRPFIVSAGEATVRAVGTAFNIRLRDKIAEVTVTEGVVAVGDRPTPRLARLSPNIVPHIQAGEGAVIGPGAVARVTLDPDALQTRMAWRQGRIELRGETLEQAVAEFNRYSDHKLVIGDARIASIRVGGAFGTGEADKFVEALKSGFDVRAVPGEGGAIYLVPSA